ncbi:hypothetical protein [Candidatus Symbiobacter mobilis]|uniref:Uncharacterized protein n=1 Tax=Candidatus Symbiobacter mobilis CR TaxID=946483 RepID=U5N7I6_9BURK|nr:hypothetical protein [Candidatus Symbiobacter mobilis]AGX87491.1 hypothetical protein Cenrod_1404 [Candidatus Symbiobacter mobilis CR]
MQLKSLEAFLPRYPALAGEWEGYICLDCSQTVTVDSRLIYSPGIEWALKVGLLRFDCPQCGGKNLKFSGHLVS